MGKHLSSQSASRSKRRQAESEFDIQNLISIAAGIVFLIVARFIPASGIIRFVLYLLPFVVLGYGVVRNAVIRMQASRLLEAEALVFLAAAAMMCIQEYSEAVIVLLVIRLARISEELVTKEFQKRAGVVFDLLPSYANVESDDGTKRMKPRSVSKGSIIDIAPGEMIPLDGVVIEGYSDVDAAPVMGKTKLKSFAPGDYVLSGCINVSNPIRVLVKKDYYESVVSRILSVSDKAGEERSDQEKFTDRYSILYSASVTVIAVILIIIGIFKREVITSFVMRASVLLLSASPAALVSAVPLTYYAGYALSFGSGVLVKNHRCLEIIAKVKTFVCNKTGTLTEKEFRIISVCPKEIDEQILLDFAATAEGCSDHPIAAAIRENGVRLDPGETGKIKYQVIPGRGVRALVDERELYVGNAELVADLELENKISYLPGNNIYVILNGEYIGHIELSNKIRDGMFDNLENIRSNGLNKFVMLTGDTPATAKSVALQLNFELVKSDLRKGAKLSALEYLMASRPSKSTLCFVGDPHDDAEELRRVDIGIGVECFNENMDISDCGAAMMGNDFCALARTFKQANKLFSISRLNILVCVCVKAMVFLLTLIGLITVWPAIIIEVLLYCFIFANSFRMIYEPRLFK